MLLLFANKKKREIGKLKSKKEMFVFFVNMRVE
jgi:hypothetical protein